MLMNSVPLVLYAIAAIRYAMQFASRTLNVSRAASTWLIMGAFAHTFVIGMETMRVGHVPFAGATSAISTFVWLLALSYLYVEMTTEERAMGVFILPLLIALQIIPATRPMVEERAAVLQGPLFGVHVSSLLFARLNNIRTVTLLPSIFSVAALSATFLGVQAHTWRKNAERWSSAI